MRASAPVAGGAGSEDGGGNGSLASGEPSSARARDAAGASCPMVSFGTDVSRESREVQARYARGLRAYVDLMGAALESEAATARATVAELVGALSLARSVARADRALSDSILEAAKARILARLVR